MKKLSRMKKLSKLLVTGLLLLSMISTTACSCNPSNSGDPSDSGNESISKEDIKYTDVKMAENGVTEYKIIIPKTADECVRYAATELELYFEQSTSADIAIETDEGKSFSSSVKYISLGDTTLKDAVGITVTKEEVNMDGYKIIRKDNSLFIAAYESRGVMYGVYEFLNLVFNYECYSIGAIDIDTKTVAYLPDLNYLDKPSFEGRFLDGTINNSAELMSKLRVKGMNMSSAKYGGGAMPEWLDGKHCESFWHIVSPQGNDYVPDDYVPQDPEEKTTNYMIHPEWFASPLGQWCLTNEELIDVAVEKLKMMILADPDAIYVNISEEDMAGYCGCQRSKESYCGMGCKESDAIYGKGGTLVRFINKIVEKLEAWRLETCPERDLKYVTFLYHSTLYAPKKVDDTVVPHEKLYLRYAPIERCFLHEFYDETCSINKTYAKAWQGWCNITEQLMVWDYRINYTNYFPFFDNWSSLPNEYKEYHDKGVINIMGQYNTGSNLASMTDLACYLNAKLMWNVNEDANKLIDDFMNGFYKEGAEYMKQYLTLMRMHIASHEFEKEQKGEEFHMGMYDKQNYYFTSVTWKKNVLEKAMSLLNKAYNSYEDVTDLGLKSTLQDRVLKESLCVRYMILQNYASYYDIYASDYDVMVDQFEADCKKLSVTVHKEGGSLADFITELRSKG